MTIRELAEFLLDRNYFEWKPGTEPDPEIARRVVEQHLRGSLQSRGLITTVEVRVDG